MRRHDRAITRPSFDTDRTGIFRVRTPPAERLAHPHLIRRPRTAQDVLDDSATTLRR